MLRTAKLLLLLLFIITGCKDISSNKNALVRNVNGKKTIQEYDKNNHLEYEFSPSSLNPLVISGEVKCYYPNGKTQVKFNLLNNQINGVYVTYFQNGYPKLISNYSKGLKNGDEYIFHENSILKRKRFYIFNIPASEEFEYNNSGLISSYSLYNMHGYKLFHAIYDSKGNFISKKGDLIEIIYSSQDLTIKKGQIISGEIQMAAPPGFTPKLYYSQSENQGPFSKIIEEKLQFHNGVNFTFSRNYPGKYILRRSCTLKNNKTGEVTRDTLDMAIIVE